MFYLKKYVDDSLLKSTDDILNKIHTQGRDEDSDQWVYLLLHQEGCSLAQGAGHRVYEVVDQYIVAAHQGDRNVGWVPGAFSLDHGGDARLGIGFNFTTSQEGLPEGSLQVDHFANERWDQAFAIRGQFSFDIQDVEITDFNLKALSLSGRILERASFSFLDLSFGQLPTLGFLQRADEEDCCDALS